jgi:hypothetical protein
MCAAGLATLLLDTAGRIREPCGDSVWHAGLDVFRVYLSCFMYYYRLFIGFSLCERAPIQCFCQKNINSKTVAHVSIMGIMLTPWGCLGYDVAAQRTPQLRKGLEGRGAAAAQGRRPCGAAEPPQSPVFCGAKNAPKFSKIFIMLMWRVVL